MRLKRAYRPRHRGVIDLLEVMGLSEIGPEYQPRHASYIFRPGEVWRTW